MSDLYSLQTNFRHYKIESMKRDMLVCISDLIKMHFMFIYICQCLQRMWPLISVADLIQQMETVTDQQGALMLLCQ